MLFRSYGNFDPPSFLHKGSSCPAPTIELFGAWFHDRAENKKRENIYADSLAFHEKYREKIEVHSKVPLKNRHDISLAYTPGRGGFGGDRKRPETGLEVHAQGQHDRHCIGWFPRTFHWGISGVTPRFP